MAEGVVIVGGGQAGFQVAASLRAGGYAGRSSLIGAEAHPPYQRPPLSKGLLLGKMDAGAAAVPPAGLLCRPGDRAAARRDGDRHGPGARATVTTATAERIPTTRWCSATGTRVRPLPVPGTELDGVVYLRTLDKSEELGAADRARRSRVVVIGGGFIGLEVAAAVRMLGKPVTVLEAADRLMGRVVAPVISAFYADLHRERGVELVLDARIAALEGEGGRVRAVVMADGTRHEADLVVIGIGVLPNVELAQAAGLACANGIVVDEHGRTSDPAIFAAGECTSHPNRFAGGSARLESVQNAVDQAKAVAAAILGRPGAYDEVPWFWSDQYEVKLQMVGISTGHDQLVIRGDPASGPVLGLLLPGRPAASRSIRSTAPGDHMTGRKLLAAGAAAEPDPGGRRGLRAQGGARRGVSS